MIMLLERRMFNTHWCTEVIIGNLEVLNAIVLTKKEQRINPLIRAFIPLFLVWRGKTLSNKASKKRIKDHFF